jgi:AraC-like DNA-binding protein
MSEPDVLTDVMDLLRVRGAVMAKVRAHAPWGLRLPQNPGASFHAIIVGSCWIRVGTRVARELLPGDVVLLPRGTSHTLSSGPTSAAQPWDRASKAQARSATGEIVLDGTGASTHVICAAYDYDHDVAHPLLGLLPHVLVLSERDAPENGPLASTLRLLRHELATARAGGSAIVNRLIEILFVHMVRAWVTERAADDASWLGALRDPIVARALTVMHGDPASAWTVETLARRVNVSRATLARRFTRLVGETPLTYLTRWRMELAARHLRDTDDAVGAIARQVGYASEFAFSRAFSRARGDAPGRYRRHHRVAIAARPSRR